MKRMRGEDGGHKKHLQCKNARLWLLRVKADQPRRPNSRLGCGVGESACAFVCVRVCVLAAPCGRVTAGYKERHLTRVAQTSIRYIV